MKKVYTAILFITAVFLLFSVSANATVMREVIFVPDYTSSYDLIGKPDVIYQNNLAFMESRTMDPEKIKLFLRPSRQILSEDEEIIELAKSLTASLKTDYSKAQAIHDWVCTNIYYDNDHASKNEYVYDANGILVDTQASDYVLTNKRALCEGYANLYCALLRAAGIPAQVYTGLAYSDGSWGPHAWTGAFISEQNRWIIVDCTWDSLNRYSNGEYTKKGMRQDYFDIDVKRLSNDHIVALTIFDDCYYNAETEEKIARAYGKDANLDLKRTDLYFYYDKVSMSKHCVIQFQPGFGPWRIQEYFDESWVSSNPKVATVDQLGNVTAHDYGTTTISLALQERGMIASFELTVEPQKFFLFCPPLTVGDTFEIHPDWLDSMHFNWQINKDYYTWKSSNPEVAVVDSRGRVTAVGGGTTTITMASLDGLESAEAEVKVKPVLEAIHLNVKTLTLEPDTSYYGLSVKGSPEEYYPDSVGMILEFESSNPQVATVGGGRRIDARSEGTAVITVNLIKYENGAKVVKLTDTCVVTVANKEENAAAADDKTVTAVPTASRILINGKVYQFDAYTINGNNYFKLRDLAMALNGTEKCFEVTWDGTKKAINLLSGQRYTPVGGELNAGDGKNKTAVLSVATVYKDGVSVPLTAYTINGNNYFKLRDVGQTFNFGVIWDGDTKTIKVDTSQNYVPES